MQTKIGLDTLKRLHDNMPMGDGPVSEAAVIEGELCRAAFRLVEPKTNWKLAIDKKVHDDLCCYTPEFVAHAVMYMTGTAATWTKLPDGTIHFQAPGYYAGPCN